ncbi:MAG TPA: fibronectin type III domain-containing protein, partial [Ilumatobacteraceae bacterium]|nr:fibronectin type III domain-containing protein [Ilumatobacteraceae bacterium]
VYAVNAIGDGVVSGTSSIGIPDRVPSPPQNLRITDYGNQTLTLQWDAPSDAGDYSTISAYEINLAGFGLISVDGGTLQRVVTGLTNGTDYTFTVRARNAATSNNGWGGSSGSSVSERPSTYPGAPLSVTAATAGDGGQARVRVDWAAPSDNGGREVTSYRVCSVQSPSDCQDVTVRTATFNVTTGSDNSYTVIAFNSDKNRNNSDVSAASNVVRGIVTPGIPTINSVTSGNGTLTVSATPGSNGGCSTTYIQYIRTGTSTWQESNVFTGLANGTEYTITARMSLPSSCQTPSGVARSSDSSNAVAQTPYGPIATPTINGSASGQTLSFSWNANQSANGRQWTVSVWPNSSGGPLDGCYWSSNYQGSATGNCSGNVGYSYSETVTIQVCATVGGTECRSAQATPATGPPPTPVVTIGLGGMTTSGGCAAGDGQVYDSQGCYFIAVSLSNSSSGSHTIHCYHSTNAGLWAEFDSYSTTNTSSQGCSYSSAGRWVTVVVDGTGSGSSPGSPPTPSSGGVVSNIYGQWPTN